ncbi:MAG: hypothetical protein QW112_04130 [Candidatus Micrarchaeia archaeon]
MVDQKNMKMCMSAPRVKFKMPELKKFDEGNASHRAIWWNLVRLGNSLLLSNLENEMVSDEVRKGWELFNCFGDRAEALSAKVAECLEFVDVATESKSVWNSIKDLLSGYLMADDDPTNELDDFLDRGLEVVKTFTIINILTKAEPAGLRISLINLVKGNEEIRKSFEFKSLVRKIDEINTKETTFPTKKIVSNGKEFHLVLMSKEKLDEEIRELDDLCLKLKRKAISVWRREEFLDSLRLLKSYEPHSNLDSQISAIWTDEMKFLSSLATILMITDLFNDLSGSSKD